MMLTTTAEVMDKLGGIGSVAALTGRNYNAAANWKAFNSFPADTFLAMTKALADKGHEAPPSLWRQVEPQAPAPADAERAA